MFAIHHTKAGPGIALCCALFLEPAHAMPSYDDVMVVVNDLDENTVNVSGVDVPVSVAIGNYFQQQRAIPDENVCHIEIPQTNTYVTGAGREHATLAGYNLIRDSVSACLAGTGAGGQPLSATINYIVFTKGNPIKYTSEYLDGHKGNKTRSIPNVLMGDLTGEQGTNANGRGQHPYYNKREMFSKDKFNIYLITYLIGYDYDQVIGLIDRATASHGNTGDLVLDRGVYWDQTKPWFVDARERIEARGFQGVYDWDPVANPPTSYITDVGNVMMYHSSGSNDSQCPAPNLYNLGFVNGAIGDTYVSSGGRSFTYGNSGGLASFNGTGWTRYGAPTQEGLQYQFLGAAAADAQYIWAASAPQRTGALVYDGVHLFDVATGQPAGIHYTTLNSGLADNKVNDVVMDGDIVWFATRSGLSKYNKSTASWEDVSAFGLGQVDLNDLEIGASGNELWVSYSGGVKRFDRGTGALLASLSTAQGLNSNTVNNIAQDADAVWFATPNGLNRWDRVTQAVSSYRVVEGLRDDSIGVVRAGASSVWVAYTRKDSSGHYFGVSMLDTVSSAWTHYYYDPANAAGSPLEDSLPADILVSSLDARVWIALRGKISVLDPVNGWSQYSLSDKSDLLEAGGTVWASGIRGGQSLVADLISEGITGVQGFVAEPYLSAMSKPEILYPRYTDGFNLAESFYMASDEMHWMNLVIGDPKVAPFALGVDGMVPAAGALNASVVDAARMAFTSPGMGPEADLDWTSLDNASVIVEEVGVGPVGVSLQFDRAGMGLSLVPGGFWQGGTTYRVTLKGGLDGIRNSAGASLYDPDTTVFSNDINWQFTTEADADGDGLSDSLETQAGTNPALADSDGDGIGDGLEAYFNTDPLDPGSFPDLAQDSDGDGLTNQQEFAYRTDPQLADGDGDGFSDGLEVYLGYSPSSPSSYPDLTLDPDGDGLTHQQEYDAGTDPYAADTDGDGYDDGYELQYGGDPLDMAILPLAITSVGFTYADEGFVYSHQVTSTWNGVTYSLQNAPAGMGIDPDTGTISWLPGFDSSFFTSFQIVVTAGPYQVIQDHSILVFQNAPGDVNGNDQLDVGDVLLLQQIALGKLVPEPDQVVRGDVTGDGVIDTADALQLQRTILGL